MTAGRTKGKDLNGSRKKHLAIRCSKRPWRNGERGRERTYFKQISLFRTRCIYVARRSSDVRVYISLDVPGRKGLAFFSLGGVGKVSNLKGLKRFPRGWRVRLSALKHRSTDDSFSLSCSSPRPLLSTVALDPFSLLLASFFPFGCDLLRTFKRTAPPCQKRLGVVPFDAENFVRREKWCRHARSASRFVSSSLVSTRAAGIASFVVCDNNFYDAHWLSEERRRYCGPHRGKPPLRRAGIREGLS